MTEDAHGSPLPTCDVLGIEFFAGSFRQAAQITIDRALSGQGGYATLTSVHGLTLAQRDPAVRSALASAWTNFPDGVPITWVQHRSGRPGAERVCGIDLMPLVFGMSEHLGLRHYLFGSTEPVLTALRRQIRRRWPEAAVVGAEAPPFGPIDEHAGSGAIARICAAEPHVVWVGLGAPKQDLWCERYSSAVAPALILGVGAAFDFVAQTKRRAPLWMQRNGLEWLFRAGTEPRRLLKRYANANSAFVLHLARSRVSGDLGWRPGGRSSIGGVRTPEGSMEDPSAQSALRGGNRPGL